MPNEEVDYLTGPPTPEIDPAVATIAAQLIQPRANDVPSDGSDDDIFDELEKQLDDDPELGVLRERRMEELKNEMSRVKDLRELDHGIVTEIIDEKEVVKTSAKEKRCVIHFYHRDFRRCDIMNKHLDLIAPKYFGTRFIRVFVENVPWLVEKLSIKVLPCLICFVDGVSKDRLIGFEEFGNDDAFETAALELRLQMSEVIPKPKQTSSIPTRSTFSSSSSSSRTRGIRGREDEDESGDDDD